MDVAAALVGVWEGSGEGGFPTIETFTYRERLEVDVADQSGLLQYRQKTWRRAGDSEVGSHVETGFIRVGEDGTIAVLNAQGHDRVEVLQGAATTDGSRIEIALHSVALAHDDRMVSSWRRLGLEGDALSYEMGMATTAVAAGALHLAARLTRR